MSMNKLRGSILLTLSMYRGIVPAGQFRCIVRGLFREYASLGVQASGYLTHWHNKREQQARNVFAVVLAALLLLAALPLVPLLRVVQRVAAAPPPAAQGLHIAHVALTARLLPLPFRYRA